MTGRSQPQLDLGPIGASERPLAALDKTLAERFGAEVEQCVAVLSSGIVALEAERPTDERWEEMMRAAHSLKGAARVVGLMDVAKLAHALEDYFVATRASQSVVCNDDVDRLLETADLFQTAGRATAEGDVRAMGHAEAAAVALRSELLATPTLANRTAVKEEAEAGTFHLFSDNDNEPTTGAVTIEGDIIAVETPLVTSPSVAISVAPVAPQPAGKIEPPAAPELKPDAAKRAGEATPPAKPATTSGERVLRVAAESIDRMMGLAGESLVESRRVATLSKALLLLKREHRALMQGFVALAQPTAQGTPVLASELELQARALGKRLADYHVEFDDYMRRVEDLSERLYREALKSRMRPFSDGAQGLPRLVRDVSRKLGKQARLVIIGENTEVDRDVLDSLDAPLNHLLRNALDHGIEDAETRERAQKPAIAQLSVEVRHQAGMFAVTLSDDGRGINPEGIRRKIVEKGLSSAEAAAAMSAEELFEFLFLPGFSTAAAVSEISGRGVGLDVVRTSIQALGGSVQIESVVGTGTKFKLLLPVTRSVLRALVTEVDGESFAFPLLRIERIDRIPPSEVKTLEGRRFVMLNGLPLALVSARRVFGYAEQANDAGQLNVVVLNDRGQRFGVLVDEFRGERDLLVRPLDPRLGKVEDIAAAALLADGSTTLIVDVEDMSRTLDRLIQERPQVSSLPVETSDSGRRRVLVVDDSITVREAERQVLSNRGFHVDVAVDGQEGLHVAQRGHYDLIVTDIDMPRMNGLELLRALKEDQRLRSIPVIVVSYKAREDDRAAGLAAGAALYLTKTSFHDRRLVEAVEQLLGGKAC